MRVFRDRRAKCLGKTDEMFPVQFEIDEPGAAAIARRTAKAVCHGCPCKDACLQFALDNNEEYGIWGGATPQERQRLKTLRTVS